VEDCQVVDFEVSQISTQEYAIGDPALTVSYPTITPSPDCLSLPPAAYTLEASSPSFVTFSTADPNVDPFTIETEDPADI